MAFEKECDTVLKLLYKQGGQVHIGAITLYFKDNNIRLTNRDFVTIFTILYHNRHINVH